MSPDGTAYTLSGPADAPVVALIHGLGLCRDVWAGLLPAFEGRYRVLNYDLFGHGQSVPAPEKASLTVYSDQLAGLLDHVGVDRAAVVGFSIGGMINRRFALDHGGRLSALAILNSAPTTGGPKPRRSLVEDRAAQGSRSRAPCAPCADALVRWFTPAFLASDRRRARSSWCANGVSQVDRRGLRPGRLGARQRGARADRARPSRSPRPPS